MRFHRNQRGGHTHDLSQVKLITIPGRNRFDGRNCGVPRERDGADRRRRINGRAHNDWLARQVCELASFAGRRHVAGLQRGVCFRHRRARGAGRRGRYGCGLRGRGSRRYDGIRNIHRGRGQNRTVSHSDQRRKRVRHGLRV